MKGGVASTYDFWDYLADTPEQYTFDDLSVSKQLHKGEDLCDMTGSGQIAIPDMDSKDYTVFDATLSVNQQNLPGTSSQTLKVYLVPLDDADFIRLCTETLELFKKVMKPDFHALVHCSAGIGRTGHFILTAEILRRYDEIVENPEATSIANKILKLLNEMRSKRPALVASENQFIFAIINATFVKHCIDEDLTFVDIEKQYNKILNEQITSTERNKKISEQQKEDDKEFTENRIRQSQFNRFRRVYGDYYRSTLFGSGLSELKNKLDNGTIVNMDGLKKEMEKNKGKNTFALALMEEVQQEQYQQKWRLKYPCVTPEQFCEAYKEQFGNEKMKRTSDFSQRIFSEELITLSEIKKHTKADPKSRSAQVLRHMREDDACLAGALKRKKSK